MCHCEYKGFLKDELSRYGYLSMTADYQCQTSEPATQDHDENQSNTTQ